MDLRISYKKIVLIIILFSAASAGGVTGLDGLKPSLSMNDRAGEKVLYWTRTYWPVYYQIDVFSYPPEELWPEATAELVARYTTIKNSWNIKQEFSTETYWRVSAMGLRQQPLGGYSNWVRLNSAGMTEASEYPTIKPACTSLYPASDPATRYPLLTWTVIDGAVYYELEFLQKPPENPNSTEPSSYRLWASREVYKNGFIADLAWFDGTSVYWRVRALDYYGKPLGVFSDAQRMNVDTSVVRPLKPSLTSDFNDNGQPTLLYPVYAWIPIPGAVAYEVELCSQPPENPYGTDPSRYRIWHKRGTGYDLYDDMPRNEPGTYYWRVRGLNDEGDPVGVYSDTGKFTVDLSRGSYAACFGDSITHGGGAMSYSPSDPEYNFETYLNFPVVNLGRSGDTTDTMVTRFIFDVLPFKPRYLLVSGGINSIRGGVTGQQVVLELMEIRSLCLENDIRPIFLTLPPVNPEAIQRAFGESTAPHWQEELAVVNQFIRQQEHYIDIEPFLSNQFGLLPERYAIDGLHPDIEGKKIMAQIINENWASVTR
jgi:lysophospholipase L1-like esterase